MTDSTRKILFGNTNLSNTIKINIHSIIEYTEKTSNILKQSHSLPREEMGIKSNNINNNANQTNNKSNNVNNNQIKKNTMIHKKVNNSSSSIRDNKTPPMRKIQKNTNSSITTSNYKSPSNKKNNARTGSATIRKNSYGNNNNNNNNFNNSSNNFNNSSNKILTRDNLNEKEEKKNDFEEPENDPKDNSLIDPLILKEISEVDNNFIQFMSNFMEKNPLEQINQFNNNNINECIIHTKEIIDQLFEYQNNYYNKFKESVALNNILIDDFNKYNELYRIIIKKQNKLNELIDGNQIKKEIIVNIRRGENNHIRQILPLKHKEIYLYKDVYNVPFNEKDIEEYNLNKEIIEKKNKIDNNEKERLLVKALKNIIKSLGNLDSVFNKDNTSEIERKNLTNLINKYQLNNFEENTNDNIINKYLEYVVTDQVDKVDEKIDNYLKSYYNKKKLPKIPFKKISPNNYEYGTIKILIKIEDDNIKVKYIGGYYYLDKFLELNAPIEDIKLKKQSTSSKKRK